MIARKEEFADMRINLDGGTYEGCTFRNCTMLYSGMLPVSLNKCFFENCVWDFIGPAGNALAFMRDLYIAGGDQREQVEDVLDKIKVKS